MGGILDFFRTLPGTVQLAGWIILLAVTFVPQAANIWFGLFKKQVVITPKIDANIVASVKQAIIEDKAK